ncbi:MAG: LysR family transcriptional regulator [Candidatus Caenarcaniphilales bacterium]|nr:LysR family transcriptional regulator [Candidatus Caenarcaniphilales bacterium]
MRKIEFKQLEYFLAVAENLSFTKAAEEIHVAQPAISQQIKYLEFVLGVPLFNRDNKKVTLTEAGHLFKKSALKVLDSIDDAVQVIEELRGLERGSVSISMSSTVATILMSDVIHEFRSQFPDIKVKVSEAVTSESISKLNNGELDLAIVTLPIVEESNLNVEHLFDEDLEAIVSSKHPLAQENVTSVDLVDLNRYQWILANNSNGLRRLINDACEQKGFCPIPAIEVDRISSVKNILIYSGNGITILPPTAVLNELSLGLVKRIPLKDIRLYRAVGLASRSRNLITPAALEMMGVVKQICYNYPERSFIQHPANEFKRNEISNKEGTVKV